MLDRSIEITTEDIVQALRKESKKASWDEANMEKVIENFRHYANGCSITFWYPTRFIAGLSKAGAQDKDLKMVDKMLEHILTILYDIFVSVLSMNFPPEALCEVSTALFKVYSNQTIRLAERRREEL